MSIKDTEHKYGPVTKLLHWVFAAVFIYGFMLVKSMDELPPEGEEMQHAIMMHTSFGVILLVMAFFRIFWVSYGKKPKYEKNISINARISADIILSTMYFMIIAVPVTGWLMTNSSGDEVSVFNLFNLFRIYKEDETVSLISTDIHQMLGNMMIAMVVIHIGASLMHHFVFKDNTLKRILPSFKRGDK